MRRALFAAVLLLTSCGGSPTRPAPAAASPVPPVSVTSGPYTLTLTLSTSGQPICTNGICAATSLCTGTIETKTAGFDVQVTRAGDTMTVTADGSTPISMRLNTAAIPATGSLTIIGPDARGVMVDARGTLTGNGSANPAIAAAGGIDGQITLGGGGCSNNGHTWTLAAR